MEDTKKESVFPAERLTIGQKRDGSDVTIVVAGALNLPQEERIERARLNLSVIDDAGRALFVDDARIAIDDQSADSQLFSKSFGGHRKLLDSAHRVFLSVALRSWCKAGSWRFDFAELPDPAPSLTAVVKSGSMTATRERPDSSGDVRMTFYAQQALPEGLGNRSTRLMITALDSSGDVVFCDDTFTRDRTGVADDLRFGERFHLKEWVLERTETIEIDLLAEKIRETRPIELPWVEIVELSDDD